MARYSVKFNSSKRPGQIAESWADDLAEASQILADLARRGFTGLQIVEIA